MLVKVAAPLGDGLQVEPRASGGTDQQEREIPATVVRTAEPAAAGAVAAASSPRERRFVRWSRRYTLWLIVLDGLAGMAAVLCSMLLYDPATYFSDGKQVVLVLGAGLAWPVAVGLCQGYDARRVGVGDDELRAVLKAAVLGIAAAAVPSAVVDKYGLVALSVSAVPVSGLLSLGLRFLGRRYLRHQQRQGRHVRRVVLVGSASRVALLHEALAVDKQEEMLVVGACLPEAASADSRTDLPILGTLDDVASIVRQSDVDAVAVAGGDATGHEYLRRLSWALEGADVELLVHPGLVEIAGPRMHIRPYVGLPLLHVEQPHFTGWRRIVKRVTDLVLTVVGLLVVSPLLAVIAVAIKMEGAGPVLFKQTRVGLDGSTFTMWKFRSMHVDAESRLVDLRRRNPDVGLMFKMAEDPRVTRVGRVLRRFSLDELPQLFNVLGGSMSLVGPRPPLQTEVDAYENHARRRLLVTPGLTGLWQVSGRSLLSWEETVRLDLRYVENWTLTLDLLILWKTFFAVLSRRGAY